MHTAEALKVLLPFAEFWRSRKALCKRSDQMNIDSDSLLSIAELVRCGALAQSSSPRLRVFRDPIVGLHALRERISGECVEKDDGEHSTNEVFEAALRLLFVFTRRRTLRNSLVPRDLFRYSQDAAEHRATLLSSKVHALLLACMDANPTQSKAVLFAIRAVGNIACANGTECE